MPKIAILTNTKAIKAHQRLAMLVERKSSESRPSGASGSNENLENEES